MLGVLVGQRGDLVRARALIEESIAVKPLPAYYQNLAHTLRLLGDHDQALQAARTAHELDASDPKSHLALVDALYYLGRHREALAACRELIDGRPGLAEAHNSCGRVFQALGRLEEATAAYRVALDFKADLFEAYGNLAGVLLLRNLLEDALAVYRAAARRNPRLPGIQSEIGKVLQELGRADEAQDCFRKALAEEPQSFANRWRLVNGHLRLIYRSDEEIESARAAYANSLHELAADIETWSEAARATAADSVGGTQPYYLAYQGKNDRDLQQAYGQMMCRIMQTRYPQYTERPAPVPQTPGERIRVGFASGYFSRHSIWKIPISGWIETLDRDRFELFGYHLGSKSDAQTQKARSLISQFRAGAATIEQWAQSIRNDRLDVLVYPELGMDPLSFRLATLRLAPVQAVYGGHPQTSGLPTMDYFLSSDLMEGPNADSHYTERLVRLANLSVHYEPPETGDLKISRADLGLTADSIVFWCCQVPFKYLPKYDSVFAKIAQRVKNARFVFIRYRRGPAVTEILQQRLSRCFSEYGLSAREHCIFLPTMDFGRFNAVARLADIYLDTIEWSGNNSLLESLAWNTPPVVLPGAMMRGRHALAILAMMGITEAIATTVDDYVDIAVRLALEPELRAAIAARVAEAKHALYRDAASVRSLEAFLIGVTERGIENYQLPDLSRISQQIDNFLIAPLAHDDRDRQA